MEYRYDNVSIDNLAITATRISRLLGVMPNGLSDSGNTTIVIFDPDITQAQKALLDTFMAGTNLDQIPATTNTVFTFDNIENVKTITGLDWDIYPTPTGFTMQFTKVLTNQDKTSLKNAFGALLKQIQ